MPDNDLASPTIVIHKIDSLRDLIRMVIPVSLFRTCRIDYGKERRSDILFPGDYLNI